MSDRRLPASGWALARDPGYLAIWSAGTLVSVARWLEMLVVGVFVFEATRSPFQVALMLILRMLPMALLGPLVGAIAERQSRKTILLAALWLMIGVSLGLALLTAAGVLAVWHVAVAAFCGGLLWVTDFPVRRMWMGDIAGARRIGAAMSLDTLTNNGTRMLGPLLGGSLLALIGLEGAFFLAAALYVAALAVLGWLREPPRRIASSQSMLGSLAEGLRHLRRDRTLAGIMAVTLVYNLWGFPFLAMIPVMGGEVLGLGAFEVGLLAATEGAGTLLGAVLVVSFASQPAFRRVYVIGLALCLAMVLLFALARVPSLAAAALFGAGLGAAGFSSMQGTLTYLNSPAELRSRMVGLLSVCIGAAPLGIVELGLLADWLGAPTALALAAVQGLGVLLLVHRLWPEVLARQPSPVPSPRR